MMGVFYTPPERTIQKHLFWLVSVMFISQQSVSLTRHIRDLMHVKQRLWVLYSSSVQLSFRERLFTQLALLDLFHTLGPLRGVYYCHTF